jgi:hypothetical protein
LRIFDEILAPADRRRTEAANVIGDRAAAMAAHDLQLGKIPEHVAFDQPVNRHGFFQQEVERVGRAGRARSGRVDMRRHIQFAQLFIERIPVAIAHRRRLDPEFSYGSGLSKQPLKPSRFTQRSSSGSTFSIGSPATCGRPQMGAKRLGSNWHCRAMISLVASVNQCTRIPAFPNASSGRGAG